MGNADVIVRFFLLPIWEAYNLREWVPFLCHSLLPLYSWVNPVNWSLFKNVNLYTFFSLFFHLLSPFSFSFPFTIFSSSIFCLFFFSYSFYFSSLYFLFHFIFLFFSVSSFVHFILLSIFFLHPSFTHFFLLLWFIPLFPLALFPVSFQDFFHRPFPLFIFPSDLSLFSAS